MQVPFKIHSDFQCILDHAESYEGYCSRIIKITLHGFAYKLVCVDDKYSKLIVVYRGQNAAYKFIEAILEELEYCKIIMKKHFSKNLIITEEEEKQFQLTNICWMCEKIIKDKKVRDDCHIARKFRGAAHWSLKINLQLTKKVPLIFHNIKGYDIHLIYNELKRFDVKIDIIPNGLEKYVAFMINKNLVFIDSMQFTNSSLEKLVKNLSDNDFKYFI